MRVLTVIPARFGSTRFPGKPLAPVLGKPMIRWVVEGALKSRSDVVVATDDERICRAVEDLVECRITPSSLPSGTDRVFQVARDFPHEVVINLQGDEPLIDGSLLDVLAEHLDKDTDIVTPVKKIGYRETSPGSVFVVTDINGFALYFSRSPIPYHRDHENPEYLKHIGIYVFWKKSLERFVSLPQGRLERIEKLEQLRALEYGLKIRVVEVDFSGHPVDYPEDIERVEKILRERPFR